MKPRAAPGPRRCGVAGDGREGARVGRRLRRPALAATLAALLAAGAGAAARTLRESDPEAAGEATAAEDELAAGLALRGDAVRGRSVYETCAACHLPSGAGRSDGTFPQLAGQHGSVLVKQLVDIRAGRRANPVMAPYARALVDAQEIADVAAYLETLPPSRDQGLGDGLELERGGRLYARDCAACHGARGEGDAERLVPALGHQHYEYLLRQVRSISSGLRGNAHPAMAGIVARYSDAELRAVVDYASRLGRAGPGANSGDREESDSR